MIAVLQFDAASARLLERLIPAGRLGNLASLLDRGRRYELASPAADFPAAAYPCLYAGVEAADHGHFYPFQWSAGEQRLRCADAYPADPPPSIWERLARSGGRSLVIDPYESLPPRTDAGICVSGWQLSERVVLPRWSRPRSVWPRLAARLGPPPNATETFGDARPGELLRLRRRLLRAPGRVAAAALHLLDRGPFDLVWVNFAAAHLAGHRLWDASPARDRLADGRRALLDGALEDIYAATDAALGRVVGALPPGADVIAVSPLGMDANTSRADLLPAMLDAVLNGGGDGDAGWIWRLRGRVPSALRGRLAGALPAPAARRLTALLELRGTEWGATSAFAHPADNQGYIRLNRRGRERHGVVDPGDADALCERIATGLVSFRDPDGAPAVAEVVRVADAYAGARADQLPDLVVRWRREAAADLDRVTSPAFGMVHRHGSGSGRSGNHTEADAWAIVAPGSSRHREPDRPPRLVDVAATVAAVTGTDKGDLAGQPLLQR